MTTLPTFERLASSLAAGEPLAPDTVRELSGTPDVVQLGMLADTLRKRLHGPRATFLRVASCRYDRSFADAVPVAAREVRITGAPETLSVMMSAVESAKAIAAVRSVSGFAWADIDRVAAKDGADPARVLRDLRAVGLDALALLPIDGTDLERALGLLMSARFERIRLTVHEAPAAARTGQLLEASRLQERFGSIRSINPLPAAFNTFRPTTGYEDVKMVAIARLAAPGIPSVQVDWQRYGPKLAQVALTFGADDLDNVSASDEAPDGRRRAPLEEVRRNIEAAGFEPVERDGAFGVVP